MGAQVEVVILHYKRPRNIPPILNAFRAQTRPVKLTLIDAHSDGFALDPSVYALADNVIRLQNNIGAFSRYVPAFGYDLPFTYFQDDDIQPGRRVIEHFLHFAREMRQFGIFGQIGRCSPQGDYCPNAIRRRPGSFTSVDSVVQGYFLRTSALYHILRLKSRIKWDGPLEDDLLAACAMRLYGRLEVLLTPASSDLQERINHVRLPSPHALCERSDHYIRRTQFLKMMQQLGWRSICDQDPAPQPQLTGEGSRR